MTTTLRAAVASSSHKGPSRQTLTLWNVPALCSPFKCYAQTSVPYRLTAKLLKLKLGRDWSMIEVKQNTLPLLTPILYRGNQNNAVTKPYPLAHPSWSNQLDPLANQNIPNTPFV